MMLRSVLGGWRRGLATTAALAIAATVARGDEPPWRLSAWKPVVEGPVFAGTGGDTWDRKIRERGFVLRDDRGKFTLWYTGYDRDKPDLMALGRAVSDDGLHWERDPANPIFKGVWTEDVCVVKKDGGGFEMVAEGRGDVAHRLSSPDGLHWTEHGPLDVRLADGTPIPPGPYGTPTLWFEDGTWRLLYERRDQGVWLATSPDMKVWTNVKDEPVLAPGPEPFDAAAIAVNQVVRRDGWHYLFYHALADVKVRDWTTNLARSRDGVHWQKYPKNPIIGNNHSSAVLVETPQGDRLYTMHPDVHVFQPADAP